MIGIRETAIAMRATVSDKPTVRVVLLPDGEVDLFGADPIMVDAKSAEVVLATFREKGNSIPIDYEHSTIVRANQGLDAPAVGWIEDLKYVKGQGIVGEVHWGDEARLAIREGKYRYLSPVIHYDDARRVTRISSVALTNVPRINHNQELAAASMSAIERENGTQSIAAAETQELPSSPETMPVSKLAGLIRLSDASRQFVEMMGGTLPRDPSPAQLCDILMQCAERLMISIHEGGDESPQEVVKTVSEQATSAMPPAAASTTKTDGAAVAASENVSRELLEAQLDAARKALDAVNARCAALETSAKSRERDEFVALAIHERKLNPTDDKTRAVLCKAFDTDATTAREILATWPVSVPESGSVIRASENVVTAKPKNERGGVIAAAMTEFGKQDADAIRKMGMDSVRWVNQELFAKGLTRLSDDEIKTLSA